jgi:uncharacterized membrane protein (DUF2068 family)
MASSRREEFPSGQLQAVMIPAPRTRVIFAIGVFKIIKGILLLALGVGLLRHQDGLTGALVRLASHLHVDPDGRHLGRLLQAVVTLQGGRLEAFKVAVLVYAAVFVTEGTGLLLARRWAEYFTVAVTGSLIPLELYELLRRPGWIRAAVLAVNALIVWYLASGLRRRRDDGAPLPAADAPVPPAPPQNS